MTTKQDDNTLKSLELSEGQLEVHFRRLNLAHTRRIYKEVADRAEKESWSYRDFRGSAAGRRSSAKETERLAALHSQCAFSFLQDHRRVRLHVAVDTPRIRDRLLPRAGLRHRRRSLILHGKTGRGKTIWRWHRVPRHPERLRELSSPLRRNLSRISRTPASVEISRNR